MMANLQKLIDLDGLRYFLEQIKARFVRSVNGVNPDSKGNVNIANMEGATSNVAGKAGLVPIPAAGKQDMALCGDATYKVLPISGGGTGQTTVAGVRYVLGLGNTNGALPIANGGTGADNATSALRALGIIGAFTGVSVNGQKLTFNKKDGSTVSVNTQDTNNGIVAALLEQNGYVKFANGLILQWGFASSGVSVTINFPIAFSKKCFGVWALASGSHGSIYAYATNTQTTKSVIIMANGGASAMDKYWLAIGV